MFYNFYNILCYNFKRKTFLKERKKINYARVHCHYYFQLIQIHTDTKWDIPTFIALAISFILPACILEDFVHRKIRC